MDKSIKIHNCFVSSYCLLCVCVCLSRNSRRVSPVIMTWGSFSVAVSYWSQISRQLCDNRWMRFKRIRNLTGSSTRKWGAVLLLNTHTHSATCLTVKSIKTLKPIGIYLFFFSSQKCGTKKAICWSYKVWHRLTNLFPCIYIYIFKLFQKLIGLMEIQSFFPVSKCDHSLWLLLKTCVTAKTFGHDWNSWVLK